MIAARLRALWAGLQWLLALPLRALVWVYQKLLSPMLPPACRYYPSCSRYAAEALATRGPFVGAWLAVRRVLRCHPWSAGGFDFVPSRSTPSFRATGAARPPHPRHG